MPENFSSAMFCPLEGWQLVSNSLMVEVLDGTHVHSLCLVKVGWHTNGNIEESVHQRCRVIGQATQDDAQEDQDVHNTLATKVLGGHPLSFVTVLKENKIKVRR